MKLKNILEIISFFPNFHNDPLQSLPQLISINLAELPSNQPLEHRCKRIQNYLLPSSSYCMFVGRNLPAGRSEATGAQLGSGLPVFVDRENIQIFLGCKNLVFLYTSCDRQDDENFLKKLQKKKKVSEEIQFSCQPASGQDQDLQISVLF